MAKIGTLNRTTLSKGFKEIEKLMYAQQQTAAKAFAHEILREAINIYLQGESSSNLTGNTLNGYGVGVWYNGRLFATYGVRKISNRPKKPTHGMTKPGDSGFKDYDSGEKIGNSEDHAVMEYGRRSGLKFQKTAFGQLASDRTDAFLRKQHPRTKGWTFIVANCTPYGEYLQEMRGYDIMDTISSVNINTNKLRGVLKMMKPI